VRQIQRERERVCVSAHPFDALPARTKLMQAIYKYCVHMCVRDSVCVCVRVRGREREREREREGVCSDIYSCTPYPHEADAGNICILCACVCERQCVYPHKAHVRCIHMYILSVCVRGELCVYVCTYKQKRERERARERAREKVCVFTHIFVHPLPA